MANYDSDSKFLYILRGFVLITALFLSACGGSEGTDASGSEAPRLSLEIQAVNSFHFTWTDVAYETEYRLLEDPDGSSGYSQVATIITDSTSHDLVVSLSERVNASYILQACNIDVCTDSNEVFVADILTNAPVYFKASNSENVDFFGICVALSGDGETLAVGAYLEDGNGLGGMADNSATNSGAVYVFTRSGTTWSQQAYLKAFNAESEDQFGVSIGLSDDGDTLAVGAYGEDGNGLDGMADNSVTDSGAVYIFSRYGDLWDPAFYVKASNPDPNDYFGISVALSGDGLTLVVGAKYEDSGFFDDQDDNSATDSGAVYVFVNDASFWYQQAYLKASVIDTIDVFGSSIALSDIGDTLAVGAPNEDSDGGNPNDNPMSNSGAAYIFTRSEGDWSAHAFLKASNPDEGDCFGSSIALSGDGLTLAVGAEGEDGNGSSQVDNSASTSGAVYIFDRTSLSWYQNAYLKASNPDTGDFFGKSLALSGDGLALAVGAHWEESNASGIDGDQDNNLAVNSGAVYVFTRSEGEYVQDAYVKASNTNATDAFGTSVALSSDGETLAVGASGEDSNATSPKHPSDADYISSQLDNSATDSGAVYLYSNP